MSTDAHNPICSMRYFTIFKQYINPVQWNWRIIERAKADSRIKRYSRWGQNKHINNQGYYLPYVKELLIHLASIREIGL